MTPVPVPSEEQFADRFRTVITTPFTGGVAKTGHNPLPINAMDGIFGLFGLALNPCERPSSRVVAALDRSTLIPSRKEEIAK